MVIPVANQSNQNFSKMLLMADMNFQLVYKKVSYQLSVCMHLLNSNS